MNDISSTAIGGLYQATQKLAKAANAIAQSPLTGADNTAALLAAKTSVIDYQANAKVLTLEHARDKALLDILA